jgi:hypothetical protein
MSVNTPIVVLNAVTTTAPGPVIPIYGDGTPVVTLWEQVSAAISAGNYDVNVEAAESAAGPWVNIGTIDFANVPASVASARVATSAIFDQRVTPFVRFSLTAAPTSGTVTVTLYL